MRDILARKPWLFIVGGLGMFVLCDCFFLWICLKHPVVSAVAP